jgi:hypothetical protein
MKALGVRESQSGLNAEKDFVKTKQRFQTLDFINLKKPLINGQDRICQKIHSNYQNKIINNFSEQGYFTIQQLVLNSPDGS